MSGKKGRSGRLKSLSTTAEEERNKKPRRWGEVIDTLFDECTKKHNMKACDLYMARVYGGIPLNVGISAGIVMADELAEVSRLVKAKQQNLLSQYAGVIVEGTVIEQTGGVRADSPEDTPEET